MSAPSAPNPTSVDDLIARQAAHTGRMVTLAAQAEEVRARAAVDFNFFAALVDPHLLRKLFPPFYLSLFQLLTKGNPDPYFLMRFALGLPRGFAKTTFLKLVACWLIVHRRNRFILVVGATEPKALDFVSDLDLMLSGPTIEELYGKWSASKSVDNAKRKIGFLDGQRVVLVPIGAEADVRGINIGNERPDLILCDDIQTREGAGSDAQNASLQSWFTASLLKCFPPEGSNRMVVFLGNMYPGDCLLQVLRKNPSWTSLITGAISESFESLWPELKPVSALLAEYEHDAAMNLGHLWFAEVQNDPLDERYKLLDGPLSNKFDYLLTAQVEHDWAFITVDPAGFRKKSDHNTLSIFLGYDGVPVLSEIRGGLWNPQETVREILIAALEVGASVIGVESVGYQQSLCYWLEYFIKEYRIEGITVVELKPNNKTKVSRIRDFIAEVQSGTVGMLAKARTVFAFWAGLFKLERTDNKDDYLDSPAYCKQIMTLHGKHLVKRDAEADLATLPTHEHYDIGV